MSVPLHRTELRCDLAQEYPRWSLASSNAGSLGLPTLIAGLCGIAVCLGAGGGLYLKNSHFWTTKAIAATEGKPQVVNRSHKDDRLAMIVEPPPRSTGPQDGFGRLEVGGPLDATITIRDANGRFVFELDPLRRTTVIAKREAPPVPPSKEPGRYMAPKGPSNCDPPSCRTASATRLHGLFRFPS